jgi:hypothetical protein
MSAINFKAMEENPATEGLREIGMLLRGESDRIQAWIRQLSARRNWQYVAIIIVGTGLYGAAMGCWRDAQQALYTAIKFPLIILLTTLGNGLLNGMLAPLLGLNLGFRQSLQAVLTSFTSAAVILGSFSPLLFFLVWNAPPISANKAGVYPLIQLTNVAAIAFAGVTANLRLAKLLEQLAGSAVVGRRVLVAWLAGNFLLGSQLTWILRPFIGSPDLPVEFFRANAMRGNFFETVFGAIRNLLWQ